MSVFYYGGESFTDYDALLEFWQTLFGSSYQANMKEILEYGKTLDGTYLYIDGVKQLGSIGEQLNSLSGGVWGADPSGYVNAVQQATGASTTYATPVDLFNQMTSSSTTQLITQNNTTVPTLIRSVVTEGGSFNNPNVIDVDYTEYTAGTGGVVATMKALGGASIPAFWAAIAPALGIAFGFTLYDLAPDFWDGLSRTLLPFCYKDADGVQKVPMVMDADGRTYFGEDVINATRNYLLESGAYEDGNYEIDTKPPTDFGRIPLPVGVDVGTSEVLTDTNSGVSYNCTSYKRTELDFNSQSHFGYVATTQPNPTGHPIVVGSYHLDTTNRKTAIVYASDTNVTFRIVSNQPGYRTTIYTGTTSLSKTWTYDNKTAYYQNISYSNNSRHDVLTPEGFQSSNDLGRLAWLLVYGDRVGGEAVPGTSVIAGSTLPLFKDPTKTLQDIHPDWYDDALNILTNATLPLHDYLNSTTSFLPVTISDTTNGTQPDETESTEDMNGALVGIATGINAISSIADMLLDASKDMADKDKDPPIYPPDDNTGDTDPPTPPVLSGAGTDLIAIYNPTKAEIISFNQWLWDLDPLNVSNWQKLFGNPIEAVISLQMLYAVPSVGAPQNIKVGFMTSSVSSKIVTNQYIDIDCGTVSIEERYHTIHDYTATTVHIYLPFIGIVPLRIGDVMKSTLHLYYRIDVLTGTCLAQIEVIKENSRAVLYSFNGTCSVQLPLTSGQFSGIFSTLLSAGSFALSTGTGIAGAVGSVAHDVLSGGVRQDVRMSGTLGSNAGAMGIRTPYVIITRNKPVTAYDYNRQYGYPAHKTVVLSQVSGYTRVRECHLESVPCTDEERAMIYRSLTDGVIIQ